MQEILEKEAQQKHEELEVFLKDSLLFHRASTASGSLFGSVSVNDIQDYVSKKLRMNVNVEISNPIKSVGDHTVLVNNCRATVVVRAL